MASPPTTSTHTAVTHNDKLWPQFRVAFLDPSNTVVFMQAVNKFTNWLSSPKAYYAAARPHIVELIEIVQYTTMQVVGFDSQVPSAFRAQAYKDENIICQEYIRLVDMVRRFVNTFEPHLRERLNTLFETITDIPPTPPISPEDKPVDHKQSHLPQPLETPKTVITAPATQISAVSPEFNTHEMPATTPVPIPHPRIPHPPPNQSTSQLETAAASPSVASASSANVSATSLLTGPPVKKKRRKAAVLKLDDIIAEDVAWYTSRNKERSTEPNQAIVKVDEKSLGGSVPQAASTPTVDSKTDQVQIEPPSGPAAPATVPNEPTSHTEETEDQQSKSKEPSLQKTIDMADNTPQVETELSKNHTETNNAQLPAQAIVSESVMPDVPGESAKSSIPIHPTRQPTIIATVLDALADHERNVRGSVKGDADDATAGTNNVVMVNANAIPAVPEAISATSSFQQDGSEPMDIESSSIPSPSSGHTDMQLDEPVGVPDNGGAEPQVSTGIDLDRTETNGKSSQINVTNHSEGGEVKVEEVEERQVANQLYELGEETETLGPRTSPTPAPVDTSENSRSAFILSSATWPQASSMGGYPFRLENRSPSEEPPSKRRRTDSPSIHLSPRSRAGNMDVACDVDNLDHTLRFLQSEIRGANMQPNYDNSWMRVLCITRCSNVSFLFNVSQEQFASLRAWSHRDSNKESLGDCLCLSLSCCTAEEFQAHQSLSKECTNLDIILSSCKVQWPSSGELAAEITNFGNYSGPKRIHLAPPVMLDMRPDSMVDITSLAAEGANTIQFRYIEHLAEETYLVYLLLHRPTPSQRARFTEQQRSSQNWRTFMQKMCLPLQLSSQPFLSPNTINA